MGEYGREWTGMAHGVHSSIAWVYEWETKEKAPF